MLLTLAILFAPAAALAQGALSEAGQEGGQDAVISTPQTQTLGQDDGFYLAPKVKRYLHSHTTYQFGDPQNPRINPLSRLEFPLNSYWGGLEMSWRKPGYALNLELMTNLSHQTDGGKFKDSDWLAPGRLMVYDEQNCRMERSFTFDMNADFSLAERLSLPKGLDLRPTLGARWQRFTLVAHDGYQVALGPDGKWDTDYIFVGDSIWFRQDYVMGYLGLKLMADLPAIWPQGANGKRTQAFLQGDWGPVAGQNKDRHLLRGDRVTEESTKGDAWHLALGLKVPVGGWGAVNLSCDYLRIRTTGDHRWMDTEDGYAVDETWSDGVKVWSDQIAFSLAWEIEF
jgi:hypothetical protein